MSGKFKSELNDSNAAAVNPTAALLQDYEEAAEPEKPVYQAAERRTKRINALIQPSLWTAAEALAAENGISVSELISRLLTKAVKKGKI